MAKKRLDDVSESRQPRADARRNREHILTVARRIFVRDGAGAAMDDIARTARLGAGTLYRHFPTRDALIEAVYQNDVEKLAEAGKRLQAELLPVQALRGWMLLLIDHVAQKKLIIPAMDTLQGGYMRLVEGTRGLVHGTFTALVQHAVDSGDLRAETDPDDFVRALIGVFYTTAIPGWDESARRIVDILIAGSRSAA